MSKVAILSDSHDNVANLEQALAEIRAVDAEVLLHCGDLSAPFMITLLAEGFSGDIHIVFGNNDGDGRLLQALSEPHDNVMLHGIYHELKVADRKIAMIHYPEPALRIAQSGQFDLVCYGHDHTPHHEQIGGCWFVNAGEILGMKGKPSWGLYECGEHVYAQKELG